MYTTADHDTDSRMLVELIELKWLLAGQGVHLHVERLQSDPDYARQALAIAEASSESTLRETARRLRRRLGFEAA